MKSYFSNLFSELCNPVPNSPVYFVARSYLLFIVIGLIVVFLIGAYAVVDHYYPSDDSTFCNVCTIILLINISTMSYLVLCLAFLGMRLYYSLWKGKMCSSVLLMQPTIALILFIAFMEMFILPGRFIPETSEMAKMIKSLIAMPGFLFAGLITFKLMTIVNANLSQFGNKK